MNAITLLITLLLGCAPATQRIAWDEKIPAALQEVRLKKLKPDFLIIMMGKAYGEPGREVDVNGDLFFVEVVDYMETDPLLRRLVIINRQTGSMTGVQATESSVGCESRGGGLLSDSAIEDVLLEWIRMMPSTPPPESTRRRPMNQW